MSDTETYRSCASVMLFRTSGDDQPEILLLHKPRTCDAWQLPQGGVEEGESIAEAALRELKEEANLDADLLGKSTSIYQYDFPESFRLERPDNVCGQRVEFIFARVREGQHVCVDEQEIDGYVWIAPTELHQYVRRREYLELIEQIAEEGLLLL